MLQQLVDEEPVIVLVVKDRNRSVTSITSITSITCGSDCSIRFRGITRNNNEISDPVIMTTVNGVDYNMCDPSYIDQFILIRRRAGEYKRCVDQYLREIMV